MYTSSQITKSDGHGYLIISDKKRQWHMTQCGPKMMSTRLTDKT